MVRTTSTRRGVSPLFNWIVVGTMAATLVLSVAVTNFSIELTGVLVAIGYVGVYAGFAHASARSPKRRDPQVMFALGATAQIVLTMAVMAPMTYVAAATNFPMQDATLLAVDRAMGLELGGLRPFHRRSPGAREAPLNVGYAMIGWPLFAIPVFLAAKRRYQRIERISPSRLASLWPRRRSLGPGGRRSACISRRRPRPGDASRTSNPARTSIKLRDLPPTRDGVLRHLDLLGLGGIVTFPSFHAASAVLFAWALWPVKWITIRN